jgi:Domain of unknown function (DUF4145)
MQSSAIAAYGSLPRPDGIMSPYVAWEGVYQRCPECLEAIILLPRKDSDGRVESTTLVYPLGVTRPVPVEVTDPYAQEFKEATAVLSLSPKASAALSRRCLQTILREKGHTKKKDLFDQIEEIVTSGKLPSHIEEGLHAVRNIGNFAAHPMKSTNTGEIMDIEPGEAEWNLDVIESLFDFYFVQPALAAKRKAELNKKLKEAGKHEIA